MSKDTRQESGQGEMQLVTFKLGSEEYAVDILSVQEIIRMTDITKVPKAPKYIEGIINLRGVVIPVLDLRLRFGLEGYQATGNTRIIVVRLDRKIVGLIVDQVSEVLRISNASVDDAPDIVKSSLDAAFIKGVGKLGERLLILLDLDMVLTEKEVNALGALDEKKAA